MHGNLVSTYESASTRRYRLGRVDNIRAASCEALEWCEAMSAQSTSSAESKMLLLRTAIKAQTDLMVQVLVYLCNSIPMCNMTRCTYYINTACTMVQHT